MLKLSKTCLKYRRIVRSMSTLGNKEQMISWKQRTGPQYRNPVIIIYKRVLHFFQNLVTLQIKPFLRTQVQPSIQQQVTRARPSSGRILLQTLVSIGLILLVDLRPTLSRLTVIWRLMEEAGHQYGAIPLLITVILTVNRMRSLRGQIGR